MLALALEQTAAPRTRDRPTRTPEPAGAARRMGMRVQIASNGLLLSRRRLRKLAPFLDLVMLRLDGVPERHDRLQRAFEALQDRHVTFVD